MVKCKRRAICLTASLPPIHGVWKYKAPCFMELTSLIFHFNFEIGFLFYEVKI